MTPLPILVAVILIVGILAILPDRSKRKAEKVSEAWQDQGDKGADWGGASAVVGAAGADTPQQRMNERI